MWNQNLNIIFEGLQKWSFLEAKKTVICIISHVCSIPTLKSENDFSNCSFTHYESTIINNILLSHKAVLTSVTGELSHPDVSSFSWFWMKSTKQSNPVKTAVTYLVTKAKQGNKKKWPICWLATASNYETQPDIVLIKNPIIFCPPFETF